MLNNNKILEVKKKIFLPYQLKPLVTTLISSFILLIVLILVFTVTIHKLTVNELANAIYRNVIQLILTGIALGVSSYLIQRISRNKFADVSIMGIGTINLIVLCILAIKTDFINKDSVDHLQRLEPWLFMIFSAFLMMIYFIVSRQKENFNYKKLIMGGVIFTFFLIALAQSIRGWLHYHANDYVISYVVGSTIPKPLTTLYITATFIICSLIWIIFNAYKLQIISINQQVAKQLGIKINFQVFVAMLCIGLMVGASYSLSGDFVYVGLIAGNMATRKRNNSLRFGVINAGIIGCIATVFTFWIASLIGISPSHIGALLPLIVGPFFIFKVLKS